MSVVVARAKLTLSLRVLGLRPDGFHDLEALAVSLERPADTLTVLRRREGPGIAMAVSGPAGAGVPLDGTNLAVRAAVLAGAGDVSIHLRKEIPAGAGLGGGSADAAATLVALAGNPPPPDLAARAGELGSDVPFCLAGGAAWMRGRGEVIEPLPALEPIDLVVAAPPFPISTAAVYRAWDGLGGPAGRSIPVPAPLAHVLAGGLVNDLEPAAEAVEPRLAPFRAALEDLAGAPALLAGSGSAYAVLCDPGGAGRAGTLAEEAENRLGARAWATRTAGHGVAVTEEP